MPYSRNRIRLTDRVALSLSLAPVGPRGIGRIWSRNPYTRTAGWTRYRVSARSPAPPGPGAALLGLAPTRPQCPGSGPAWTLGHAACRLGHNTLYIRTSRLLAEVGGGHAGGTGQSPSRRYLEPDRRVVDDCGTWAFSAQQREDLWELSGERRYGNLVRARSQPRPGQEREGPAHQPFPPARARGSQLPSSRPP